MEFLLLTFFLQENWPVISQCKAYWFFLIHVPSEADHIYENKKNVNQTC